MYIHVKVTPGAKADRVTKVSSDKYEMWVREKAERNLANKKVTELLARTLGVEEKLVRLISGHTSPSKLFSIFDTASIRMRGSGGVQNS
ncbi:MAG: DUF167 domain-containing protein [Candidatus Paceibacterota bacterium]|jgi:uncharacterized protein YggU (UPF0235/DUF167 family)